MRVKQLNRSGLGVQDFRIKDFRVKELKSLRKLWYQSRLRIRRLSNLPAFRHSPNPSRWFSARWMDEAFHGQQTVARSSAEAATSAISTPAANPGEFPAERGGPLVGVTKVILGGNGLWSMIRTDFQETPE
jgi:hypothetical protein